MATDSTASPTIRWRKGELIGAGAYGRVYMGMNLDSGELLAVKQVLFAVNTNARDKAQVHVKELEEEVKVLRNLSHPNIVRYLGTAREEDALNIFLEFVPGGSIASLLGKFGSFPESVIRMYTRQLLQGLEYLHKNGIMHRDVKGANILVDNKGCIKLADFGASKQVVELATVSGAKSMKGTPYWMAPEVIRQTGHGLPADIWSVGCTVIEMATGKPPWSQQFQEVAALFHIGTTKSHPPIPDHLSQEANDFLLKCLEKEPNLRPTASELLCHPFVLKEISQCEKSCKSILTVSGFGEERPIRKSTTPLFANKSGMCSLLMQGSFRRIFGAKIPEQCSDSYMDDQNCSVRLESIQFDKESANMSEPSSFYPMQEPTSFNPMEEPTSFDPMQERSSSNSLCEPFEMKSGWGNKGFLTDQEDWQAKRVQKDDQKTTEFSFQCGTTDYNDDDDDDVTESKIKAFLDEKALELKRLQTPLFEEFHSIWNVSRQNETGEQLMVPLSPVVGRQFVMNNKSPSKGSSPSGPSFGRNSYSSETSISSGSPVPNARSNVMPLSEVPSPRVNEWKGLLEETQHLSPNPGVLNPAELQKLWKEELQQELEMKREEKRKLSRLVGSRSKSSSPNSKLSSPHETAVHRHSVSRLSFASPTQLPS